ncbi:hypothetical protein DH2020_035142 [Rehmannia glutinosa]|uniref:1-phosphatidylinositol-3-phosphate 5-kinase n=1 Tax=Rehmannia glutinosa TaxID=99300 RepID=A0ABR0V8A7_REHGL
MHPDRTASVKVKLRIFHMKTDRDISVVANFYDRGYIEDCSTDSCQEDSSSSLKRQIGKLVKNDPDQVRKVDTFGTIRNVETVQTSEVQSNDEVDAGFWFPPDPEDEDEDVIGSVANFDDDDDECGDGVTWAKPSFLSSFGKGSGSFKFNEEKLKIMDNVRNGKFTALVSQLVKSVGVDCSGNYGENWVDIVTSLSWEAAAFVKPDTNEGKAMDPNGYVKVKCIATGLRTQSRLIKGLVFKKHAAHKHMPTKYKNPRLLLIHGSLDLSSGGLSSFGSMQQEKNNLKSIVEMIEVYHPNVILVEKSVARDLQESILAKGMTLVFDMKLHRLERVDHCIGSPILSTGLRLRQCDSFHIEKFVEEHGVSSEGGKKPRKTLMFLEGCPSRHGCTIVLMGANSDELKRIKCVVRCAVIMAYHLMMETSFLLDQSAMFSTISSSSEVGFPLSFQSYNPAIFPGLSRTTSIRKVMNDSFPVLSDSSEGMPSPICFNGRNQAENEIQISSALHAVDHYDEKPTDRSVEENLLNNDNDTCNHIDNAEDHMLNNDEISAVLDSESILVLMSSRNASRGTICEQSHFSHIKFYRSFDVPLGKFLHHNLLNQRLLCKACGETPEVHIFYYAHHNKQLTIQVTHLPARKSLPGETEGKLWMWSRCDQCKFHDGTSISTKRVVISTAARGLSFGKFLELGFSNHSSFCSPSTCGHSFHKDFLHFFGLGPMVAMFKYSPIATHSVSLPPQKMEFNASVSGEFLKKEYEHVYSKGISVFLDIEKLLKDIETQYVGVTLNIQGSTMEFSDFVHMLEQEKSQFEVDIQNAVENYNEDDVVYELLSLNRIKMELLIESCIWDRRLHALLSSDLKANNAAENLAPESSSVSETKLDASVEDDGLPVKEIHIDGQVEESGENNSWNESELAVHEFLVGPSSEDCSVVLEDNSLEDTIDSSDKTMSIPTDISLLSNLGNDKDWIWAPFTNIIREYMEDLQRGYLPKIESFSSYAAQSTAQKLITDEGSRMHIPLGINDYIVSDYEEEFSSIIACALTLLKDVAIASEDLTEDARKERGMDFKSNGSSHSLRRVFSFNVPHSLDSDGMHSPPANLRHAHSLSFDGLDLLDPLVSNSVSHPEVSMGLGKYSAKRKYSVVCLYASQFRQLRDRCCPSEVYYIASLSRCRNWDAKGGKSKSFFAKTLDDRFIIKEIKRTEFDSFVKFASNYFEYMNQCYKLGNQTCLAKILGIYQVTIRATKNGKETKHDLLVMENLSFGRHIDRQYDLKGALHARFNSAGNNSGDVLLDQNFVNDMNVSPLYVSRKSKRNLQRAVYNDTNFLNSINVMDYSLLVGVDTERRELSCGIIDYLRQYTWDKQLENWVKSSLVVPKNQLPTIISPKEYKKRFRKFINTHFLSVPDHWCSQRSSNPCKLCGPALENGSLHNKSQKRCNQDDDLSHVTSQKQWKHEAGSLKSPNHGKQMASLPDSLLLENAELMHYYAVPNDFMLPNVGLTDTKAYS